jgi:hypothetical protein
VPLEQVRQRLIDTFARWGKPGAMRVDNGLPLGCPASQLTPVLALWLIAIDVAMIWNKPACPQQNGRVEKMQDTTARWAEIEQATTLSDLQTRLEAALQLHRQTYPVIRLGGKTRLAAFPQLETSRRRYGPSDFSIERVYGFLSAKLYTRKVSVSGQISHYGTIYSVGLAYKQQWVQLRLTADGSSWEVLAGHQVVKRVAVSMLTAKCIQNLTVMSKSKST